MRREMLHGDDTRSNTALQYQHVGSHVCIDALDLIFASMGRLCSKNNDRLEACRRDEPRQRRDQTKTMPCEWKREVKTNEESMQREI